MNSDDLGVLDSAKLIESARRRANLEDFGDEWFLEPMNRFIDAANEDAALTPQGYAAQAEAIVNGLVNRLRMVDDLKRHPEILNEDVKIAAIILGLPRTGSTILHKLLSDAPGMTALRWYEAQNYAPLPGESKENPNARREYAQQVIDGWLAISPEIASQHPMYPDAPAEEIMLLGQLFVSTMVEGMAYVPSFSAWLDGYDQSKGHADLKRILQYLQWQDPSRRGQRWVLKSPSNLPYVEVAARTFPEALLIMTHRNPRDTVPSCISMQTSLYRLGSTVPEDEIAAFWFARLATWMDRFDGARDAIGADRFVDIDYADFIRDPVAEGIRLLKLMGEPVDADVRDAMAAFMSENKRDKRPQHNYSLDRFNLTEDDIERTFGSRAVA